MSLRDVFRIKEAAIVWPKEELPAGTKLWKSTAGELDISKKRPSWFATEQWRAEEYFENEHPEDADRVVEVELIKPLEMLVLHRRSKELTSPFDSPEGSRKRGDSRNLNDPNMSSMLNTYFMARDLEDAGFENWAWNRTNNWQVLSKMKQMGHISDAIFVPEMDDLCIFDPSQFVKFVRNIRTLDKKPKAAE